MVPARYLVAAVGRLYCGGVVLDHKGCVFTVAPELPLVVLNTTETAQCGFAVIICSGAEQKTHGSRDNKYPSQLR